MASAMSAIICHAPRVVCQKPPTTATASRQFLVAATFCFASFSSYNFFSSRSACTDPPSRDQVFFFLKSEAKI
jgi:hypothetical protein